MKKSILVPLILIMFFTNCANRDNVSNRNFTDSVIVYGNLHLIPKEIMSHEDLAQFENEIVSTQHWIYDNVTEDIILLEGYPFDSQITPQYYENFYRSTTGKELDSSLMVKVKKFSKDYDIQTLFILENKKIIFGSEDKPLYDLISNETLKRPELNSSQELVDVRSISMAQNAVTILRRYNKKVAIIVGDNHLDWFEKHGYTVYHPPAMR